MPLHVDDVVLTLCRLIGEQTQQNPAQLGPETSLRDDVVLDSLGQMALLVSIENTFEVCLTLDESEALPETVAKLAELVVRAKSAEQTS